MSIFDELTKSALEMLVQTGTQHFRYRLSWPRIVERPVSAYLTQNVCGKTCISCGSETQPCCGH